MRTRHQWTLASLALILLASAATAAHKPIQPPYSWRGIDGTGVFPAGDLVTAFWDIPAEAGVTDEVLKKALLPASFKPGTRSNVVWRTTLPHWGNNVPVVMGDCVFLMTEEGWRDDAPQLVCVSVADGKIVWQRPVDHLDAWPPEEQAEAKKMRALELKRWREHMTWWHRFHADPETGVIREPSKEHWDKTLAEARAAGWAFSSYDKTPFNQDGNSFWRGRFGIRLGGSGGRCMDASLITNYERCAKERIYWRQDWTSESTWYGSTMGSVVGDGKVIYAVTALSGAAAYDLAGYRLWVTDLGLNRKGHAAHRNIASPVLAQDRLVYYSHGDGEMIGLDVSNGKVLWRTKAVAGEQPNPSGLGMIQGIRGNRGHMAPGGTPVVMRISGHTVVVSNHGMVVRVADGRYLGQAILPQPGKGDEGPSEGYSSTYYSWTARDDVLYASGHSGPACALRLSIAKDELHQELVWKSPWRGDSRDANFVVLDDRLLVCGRSTAAGQNLSGLVALDRASGAVAAKFPEISRGYTTAYAVCPTMVVGFNSANLRGGRNVAGFTIASVPLKKLGQGLLVPPRATGELRERHVAFLGTWELNWTAHAVIAWGNRIFVRNNDYLWCIGDASKEWMSPEQYLNRDFPVDFRPADRR